MADVNTIDPAALNARLNARLNDANLLLLQVTTAEVFAQAHIPGAVLVTPQELVCGIPPATGKLPALNQLTELFSRLGYTPEAQVVVYDDEGGGWAGRLGWTLDVIGHRQWDYLDGGIFSWAAAGLPLETGAGDVRRATQNLSLSIDTTPIAELEDVLAGLDDHDQMIWDVRSPEEYLGLKQASTRVGHIPGAVNYDWLLLKDQEQYLNPEADQHLAALGLDGQKPVVTHCQTHHRSGLSYMWGRLKGWNIRAYHGSWSEWGNRDDTPITNPSAES